MKNFKTGFNTGSVLSRMPANADKSGKSRSTSLNLQGKANPRDLKASHVDRGLALNVKHVNTDTGYKFVHVVNQHTGFNTRVLANVKMPVSSFVWGSVGGILVGIGLLSTGVIVMITTGGTAAALGPAVFSSVCTAMGTTGILYAAEKIAANEELDWTCYASETLVSGAIALGTMGVSKGLAMAKGLESIAKLSNAARAGASAFTQGTATAIRNSIEGRNVCDSVLDTAVAAFAGGLAAGALSGGAHAPTNSVAVSNAALARGFVASVATGGLTGGAAAAVSCATRNAIAGENLFANLDEAIAGGVKAGAISGAVSGVVLTAQRVQQRALHNQMFALRRDQVAAGGVAGGFELSLWCEATGTTAIVQDPDGACHVYGSTHSDQPPIVLSFTPGASDGEPGHYTRLGVGPSGNIAPQAISGEFTCLADALGVTPRDLAAAVHTRFSAGAFGNMTDAQVHALHDTHVGGTNLAAYERHFLDHPNENVQQLAGSILDHRGTRGERTFLRQQLAHMLLADERSNINQAYAYNDAIPPRAYSFEYSHANINPNFSEDRTNTGFAFAGQNVEHIATDPNAALNNHRIGVFVHPERGEVLVSNNNRGLAHHALVSSAADRYVWVENVRYEGENGSNFASWENNGRQSVQVATFEHSGTTANAQNVRWGRTPNTPGPIPDHR